MKKLITLIVIMIMTVNLVAQSYSPCYTNNMAQGDEAFKQGKYSTAKNYYATAKQCAGGNPSEAQKKINQCNVKIEEQKVSCKIEPMSVVSVYSESGRTLYGGITNKLYFTAPDMSSKYVVKIPNCEVKRDKAGEMNVVVPVSMIGKTITVSVEKEGGQKVSSVEFRVISVPDPHAYIGSGIVGGKRSKSELTANPYLRAEMDDGFVYDLTWTIESYTVIFMSKGYEDSPLICTGADFSEEVMQKIAKSGSCTVIIFTGIRASCGDSMRTLREVSVRIK